MFIYQNIIQNVLSLNVEFLKILLLGHLFLVCVNDLLKAFSSNVRMFADDTVLFCSHKNSQNVQAIPVVNNELLKVSKWFYSNKLSIGA